MSMQLSDPRPAFCSACHNSPRDARYVDFDAAHDGGAFVDRETQSYVQGSDDLHLCDACLLQAAELLKFKPQLHARQLGEIRRQAIVIEHWRDYARKLEATLAERPELAPSARRKVAA